MWRPSQEGALIALLSKQFPNVSAVRVRDAIASAAEILRSVGAAVRVAAGVALVAGVLVLAGAMAAGQQRRIYEFVLLKMLGGRRRDIAMSFLWEFALLALSAAAIALLIGSIGAWFFLSAGDGDGLRLLARRGLRRDRPQPRRSLW